MILCKVGIKWPRLLEVLCAGGAVDWRREGKTDVGLDEMTVKG